MLESGEEKKYMTVKSKLGLQFTLDIPALENTPRNILGKQLFNLTKEDEVVSVQYEEEFEYAEFTVGVTAKGNLKSFAKAKKNDRLKVNTDNLSNLVLFTNKGNVYKIPTFLIKNVVESEIAISSLIDGYSKDEKIVDIYSLKSFEVGAVYFFSKKGMVKKSLLKEYDGDYASQVAYKFKFENDEIINVCITNDILSEIIILTKKGMAIRFLSESVSTMGRVASGVTGISLKEDDSVIQARVKPVEIDDSTGEMAITSSSEDNITIISKNDKKKVISASDIKLQNRAGRGTSVMLTGFDDEVVKIEL